MSKPHIPSTTEFFLYLKSATNKVFFYNDENNRVNTSVRLGSRFCRHMGAAAGETVTALKPIVFPPAAAMMRLRAINLIGIKIERKLIFCCQITRKST
jgi:hypothetical protein